MINRYILCIWFLFFGVINSSFAANVNSIGSFQSSCPWANVNAQIYFSNGANKTVAPADEFWTPSPAFILNWSTDIDIWSWNGGSANCLVGWNRASNFSPGNSQHVNAFYNNNCSLTRNTNPNVPFAQIVFRVGYKNELGFTAPNQIVPNQYFNYSINSPIQNFISDQRTRIWWSVLVHSNECLNYYARWCGDGILDSANGESCDLGAQNGQPGSACSATCTPVTGASCIPGTTVGPQSSEISASTAGLCLGGSASVGWFTRTPNGTSVNYTWSCNGSPVGGACSASFTTGGGGGLTCTPGNFVRDTGGIVPAPITIATPGLCPTGETVGNFIDTPNGSNHSYKWSCNGIGAGLACTAFYNVVSGGGWGGGGGTNPTVFTVPWSSSVCGNGVVERPNSLWIYENCDTDAIWCVRDDGSCTIASTTPGSIFPGKLTITNPGIASMDINAYQLIVWNQVPLFSANDRVFFETSTPIYLQNKTATITNKATNLIDGTTVSKTINNVWVGGAIRFETGRTHDASGNLLTITYDQTIYPPSTLLFDGSELLALKGDTTSVSEGYEDTVVTNPAYRSQGIYASLQYLEAPFHIRVSKPIIGNTAGGSAFIGSALGNSVNTVVQTFFNNLRSGNFTTSTVNVASSYALSSQTTSVSDNTGLSNAIASVGTSETSNISQGTMGPSSGIQVTTRISSEGDFDSKSTMMGDMANIRVFRDGDVSIDEDLNILGIKTVVIENGNLIINKNMTYKNKAASIAWIVKNGNIIIADTVTNIVGVYVTLAGAIESNGVSTADRLSVDGSLYGNTTDLVNHRTYVRGQTGYSALNVGVVVNYSNRAIMYPPPFLSRFLDQYSLQRVVR